jgi:hypothetical protein
MMEEQEIRELKLMLQFKPLNYLENKDDLKGILQLSHLLSDNFYVQGLPIAISTRKALEQN